MKSINQRKREHLDLVLNEQGVDREKRYFDAIRLTHRALPEVDFSAIDPSVTFLGKELSFPLIISSMTGGSDAELRRINQNLAAAAEAEGIGFALGSQRVGLLDQTANASFNVRDVAPTALLMSNLGAVQLNEGVEIAQIKEMLLRVNADALFLHLNPLQEMIQPRGDRNFSNLAEKIARVVSELSVPVIIKEVGAGISPQDIERLLDAGVHYIDLAGTGGTSWSQIEGCRCEDASMGSLFADWGIPTPQALRLAQPYLDRATFIASGGLRSGVDMVKSLVLGASVCGMARPFLAPATDSVEAVRAVIQRLRAECVATLFLLGATCVKDVQGKNGLILNEDWYR